MLNGAVAGLVDTPTYWILKAAFLFDINNVICGA